jgi:P-type E1-E2 ATPase
MGGANNICSDKTGTLTMNKMTLTTLWNGSLKKIDTHNKDLKLHDLTTND